MEIERLELGKLSARSSVMKTERSKISRTNWRNDSYWHIFQPYLHLSRICGVGYLFVHPLLKPLAYFYCFFTFALIAFNIFRGISFILGGEGKGGFSAALVFKCVLLLYAVHCLTAFLLLMWTQRRSLEQFVNYWRNEVNEEEQSRERIPYYKWAQRVTYLGILYTVGISVVNGLFVGLGSVEILIEFPFMKSYFYIPHLMFTNGINVFYTSLAFSISQAVYSSVCFVIFAEYLSFNRDLERLGLAQMIHSLPRLRRKHFHITNLTRQADQILSYYALAIFALNAPTSVIVMFLLVRDNPDEAVSAASRFTLGTWVCVLFLQIALVSILPAAINYLAHKPLRHVQQTANLLSEHELKMPSGVFRDLTLFLGQLSTQDGGIGITGGGFFVITKAMLLTLISILLSYFAIIVQFDMATKTACICDPPPRC